MDTTIRNLDEDAYRELKAHAARSGRTIGEAINEAMRFYLAVPSPFARRGSLFDLKPERYPQGSEGLSEEIDQVVYGIDG
jgi:plasmid stability protein